MSEQLKLIIGAIAATVMVTSARADTIAYNTSLAAGYYNGTGNPNAGFTTDTSSTGVQLGLGVNLRFIGPVLPTSTNIYNVPTGTSAFPPAGTAAWDFEYSVDFGNSGLTQSTTTAALTVLNVTTGESLTFDPSSSALGNATNGDGYQNAENLGFSFVAVLFPAFGFDPNAADQYQITLNLSSDGDSVASVDEIINATPLPTTFPLFAGGLGFVGYLTRRKKRGRALATA